MDLFIRHETEKDFREVEALTREAFWNLYVPGCNEHFLVHSMRQHPDFIQDLDFVAERDGRLVGNIMYTQAWLVHDRRPALAIATFGPVSVLPKYQRQGIGGALIQHTLRLALKKNIPGIVILGDPHNYCKHGFKSAKDLKISDKHGEYPAGMLALELKPGAFLGETWQYQYSGVYDLDEEKAGAFDQTFPPKEKGHQYSQDIFSIIVRSHLK